MISYEVLSTVHDVANKRIEVIKEITEDDGTKYYNLHCFSTSTLEWRSAEYGVEDPNALVEIVLNEPFIESTEHLNMSPAEAAKLHTAKVQAAVENLKVVASAPRLVHKARMLKAGIAKKYVDAVDKDPIAAIKSFSVMSQRGLAVKRNYVEKLRADRMQDGSTESVVPRNATRTVLRKGKKV